MRSLKDVVENLPRINDQGEPVVLLLTGEGKGKTTAGLGQILRAVGRGYRCAVFHFMKGVKAGEDAALEKLGVDVYWSGPDHFMDVYDPKPEERKLIRKFWEEVKGKLREYDVVFLDEFNLAVFTGILSPDDLKEVLDVPPYLIILGGRRAPPELVELASVASEVKLLKHHYPKVGAMRGFEV